ncbi:MAG: NAD(+) diphosphatase [Salinispira sp.]
MLTINFNKESVPRDDDIFILFAPDHSDVILLEWTGERVVIPHYPHADGFEARELSFIGMFQNRCVWCGFISEQKVSASRIELLKDSSLLNSLPAGQYFFIKLRYGLQLLNSDYFETCCRARMIAHWRRRTRFCGVCGMELQVLGTELAMQCPVCTELYYPQISPAVIVAVHRNDELLMVKSTRSSSSFYGLVAGYVEAGETVEDAVHREVLEETKITITHVQYIKSQAWPFPNSQMLAFTADYVSGNVCIQKEELLDAQWFKAHEIPPMPPRLSVGRFLVDRFIQKQAYQKQAP